MKAYKTPIIESSLLCLLLFAEGCSTHKPEIIGKVSQQNTIDHSPQRSVLKTELQRKKTMPSMTLEEAKKILQEAEQVLQETKVQVEKAEKKYLTLEEMLEACKRVSEASNRLKLIPSEFITTSDSGINAQYNKLQNELPPLRNKLWGIMIDGISKSSKFLIDRTTKAEKNLSAFLEALNEVTSRYPAPDLIKLRDQISRKRDEIKQVSDDQFEKIILSAKNELKGLEGYKNKAQESREKKDFDSAAKWRLLILSSANRSADIARPAYQRLNELKGNTSGLISRRDEYYRLFGLANTVFNKEHDLAWDSEGEWAKTLDAKKREETARNIINEAEKTIQQAREADKRGNVDDAYILSMLGWVQNVSCLF